ncbi:hypothetical protein FRB97_008089 [Tulasnella sp. 331]|nr:hypothetical protein FRB97_008089 [Tulasnella sp. 331]
MTLRKRARDRGQSHHPNHRLFGKRLFGSLSNYADPFIKKPSPKLRESLPSLPSLDLGDEYDVIPDLDVAISQLPTRRLSCRIKGNEKMDSLSDDDSERPATPGPSRQSIIPAPFCSHQATIMVHHSRVLTEAAVTGLLDMTRIIADFLTSRKTKKLPPPSKAATRPADPLRRLPSPRPLARSPTLSLSSVPTTGKGKRVLEGKGGNSKIGDADSLATLSPPSTSFRRSSQDIESALVDEAPVFKKRRVRAATDAPSATHGRKQRKKRSGVTGVGPSPISEHCPNVPTSPSTVTANFQKHRTFWTLDRPVVIRLADGGTRTVFRLHMSQLTMKSELLKQLLHPGSSAEAKGETIRDPLVYYIPENLGLKLKGFEWLLKVMPDAI